ncbi:uncharacterized protein MELLADRAFT_103127 [Melampsora larici-populina 98AG31]|uniref:Uncharacterized protein n=1 Tax=Melampsora larici-populina (strain 98AG31 / pathotype 3-4-7) TaxID=747676 RepID=F4RAM7_MELLP|nr:uncharacterized protein MELLADRAFT_103127 [Melampsora larici-populina 98AG31]EGG10509.1 hypothetical protein MELLADRAFT_103127 [Melampsora larici-populina 98AG31]
MAACDCSNCKPDDAEALWLAQPCLTNANFQAALDMDELQLLNLIATLPNTPLPPVVDLPHVAMLCGPDDPILECPILERLVTRLERAFAAFWHTRYTQPCHLGPDDYFGRDLAWDLAKNVDLLREPHDFGVVLASEAIKGQYNCLFAALTEWKDNDSATVAISQAAARRKAVSRPPTKPVQSVEGALLSKRRADAEKLATKEARLLERQQLALDKANEKAANLARKLEEKAQAEEARAALKAQVALEKAHLRAQQKEAQASATSDKRRKRSGGSQADPDRANKRVSQDIPHFDSPTLTTRQQHPSEIGIFDPRLGVTGVNFEQLHEFSELGHGITIMSATIAMHSS